MGRRLRPLEGKTKYIQWLETRIKDVCSGHVRWLQRIRTVKYDLPTKSAERPPWSDEDIPNEGIIKFRLDDHFWILKALISLDAVVTKIRLSSEIQHVDVKEVLKHKTWLQRLYLRSPIQNDSAFKSKNEDKDSTLSIEDLKKFIRSFRGTAKRLSPKNVQRAVLQRFTTENDFFRSGRRMLAVTRSAMEIRFLLHARDTALFNDDNSNSFMPCSSFEKLWASTIDAQLHHEENMNLDWENALRYALGIAMGVRGHTPSGTNNASELVKRSVNILIPAGGSDAFFQGQSDEWVGEPTIFTNEKYRNHFYHAGFEIYYVLLSSASSIDRIPREKGASSAMGLEIQTSLRQSGRFPVLTSSQGERKAVENGANFMLGTKDITYVFDNQPNSIMKKSFPSTNVIPATNVNNIDDEWLYQYPDFLRGQRSVVADNCSFKSDSSDSKAEAEHPMISMYAVGTRKGKQHLEKRRGDTANQRINR